MAYEGDKGGKCHNKSAGTNSGFQFIAKKGGKNNQHHHASAGADEAGAEAYGKAEKEGNNNVFGAKFGCTGAGIFSGGIGPYKETNADAKGEKQGKATQDDVICQIGYIAANGT